MPSGKNLMRALWPIAFPGTECPDDTRLQDAFAAALLAGRNRTIELIRSRLTVDSTSIPAYMKVWLDAPWRAFYTLNLDNVDVAITNRFTGGRGLSVFSATSDVKLNNGNPEDLEVAHLNGSVVENPAFWTFADADYSRRQSTPDAHYVKCVTDLLSRPVIFVGTELNESTLWHFIEQRRAKGARGVRELRPRSYLVTPFLNPARATVLRDFNVEWLPYSGKEFVEKILTPIADSFAEGHRTIRDSVDSEARKSAPLRISEIPAGELTKQTEYLLGNEPEWSDIQQGRAVPRECDVPILNHASEVLRGEAGSQSIVVSGTAGSGKSTALKRLALQLNTANFDCYWIDADRNVEPSTVATIVRNAEEPVALFVDDIDLWGQTGINWIRELPEFNDRIFVAAGLRSPRLSDFLANVGTRKLGPTTYTMPPLEDSDIDSLIASLDTNSRLGVLRGLPIEEQRRKFREQAGRQLLVAMIQATSGQRLVEKIGVEYDGLNGLERSVYAVVCVASSNRYKLTRQDIVTAINRVDNDALNATEALVRSHLVVRDDVHTGYAARHRLVADEVVNRLVSDGSIKEPIASLAYAVAASITPNMPDHSVSRRRLRRLINHDYLLGLMPPEDVSDIYDLLEPQLEWSYHFWLQRGAAEVEKGSLRKAENFLQQARSFADSDWFVETEWAYLQMKWASASPNVPDAVQRYEDGDAILRNIIDTRGHRDRYPYHVLGSQGLSWSRRAPISDLARRTLLRGILDVVSDHPRADELRQLQSDLRKDWLMTAVANGSHTGAQQELPSIAPDVQVNDEGSRQD